MNPRVLFWTPIALRLLLVALGVLLGWRFLGLVVGLLFGIAALAALVLLQLYYLYRLGDWLENPSSARMPDGWGAWTGIFSRLYRMRRADEKHQSELSEWLARFREAMHLLPDGVAIVDDVLFLEWCNPAAERHLGLTLERDEGRRVTNLVRSPAFIDYIILARYDQPLTLAHGDRKLIIHMIPFENRRQIIVTHDVTDTERIEMMRRDFIANASHELRTPLTAIIGFLEIASTQPDLDVKTRMAHLKLMSEQGSRMKNLVEDMLSLSRLESPDYPVRQERVAIAPLLEMVLRDAEALSAGRHQFSLMVDGPDIKGSREELYSAFGNLAANAVRYTAPHGCVDLVWQVSEQGPWLEVRDSGIGISPEHISRLTERFYRVDKSRSRETQGTGLGLAIVKHVLLRHGATLHIDSEPELGSVFTVKLPPEAVWRD